MAPHRRRRFVPLLLIAAAVACGPAETSSETPSEPDRPLVRRPVPPPPRPEPPPPAPSPPRDPRTEHARDAFGEAIESFERGDYLRAIAQFRVANELHPNPAILFNIAACQEHLGDLPGAIDTYHQYLGTLGPDDPPGMRERVLETIRNLEERLRTQPDPETPPDP